MTRRPFFPPGFYVWVVIAAAVIALTLELIHRGVLQ